MKELGQYLKEKRESKNIKLDDIEKETGIMSVLLDGLERGDTQLFINLDNYDDLLSFYCDYLKIPKKAVQAQVKIMKMHEQRGASLTEKPKQVMKELLPALKLIKERQRVSLDLLEINFGSYEKAKEIFQHLQDNGFIVKRPGATDWLINTEKINEYIDDNSGRGY